MTMLMRQASTLFVAVMAAILFRCVAAANSTSSGQFHIVGDYKGWELSSNLSEWSLSQTFLVNDCLVFQYGPNHDVIEVNRPDYNTCTQARPIAVFVDGETKIRLDRPGTRYFISGRNQDCDLGLKVQIKVHDRDELGLSFPSPIALSPFANGTAEDNPTRRSGRRPRAPPTPHSRTHPPPPPPSRSRTPSHDNEGKGDVAPAPSSGQRDFSHIISLEHVILLALITL